MAISICSLMRSSPWRSAPHATSSRTSRSRDQFGRLASRAFLHRRIAGTPSRTHGSTARTSRSWSPSAFRTRRAVASAWRSGCRAVGCPSRRRHSPCCAHDLLRRLLQAGVRLRRGTASRRAECSVCPTSFQRASPQPRRPHRLQRPVQHPTPGGRPIRR